MSEHQTLGELQAALEASDKSGRAMAAFYDENVVGPLREELEALREAVQRFQPYAEAAEMRWMSVEDATIEVPARAVAEATRALKRSRHE